MILGHRRTSRSTAARATLKEKQLPVKCSLDTPNFSGAGTVHLAPRQLRRPSRQFRSRLPVRCAGSARYVHVRVCRRCQVLFWRQLHDVKYSGIIGRTAGRTTQLLELGLVRAQKSRPDSSGHAAPVDRTNTRVPALPDSVVHDSVGRVQFAGSVRAIFPCAVCSVQSTPMLVPFLFQKAQCFFLTVK
jgi:hypothetical protein